MRSRKNAPIVVDRVTYCRTFPGHFPGVSEWIEVVVERHADGWSASCSLGFPDPDKLRDQWNTWRLYADREEAARYAADFVVCAEELLSALDRGERPYMPHRAQARACDAALLVDARLCALALAVKSGTERRDVLSRARDEALNAWYRAHDWREFRAEKITERDAAE